MKGNKKTREISVPFSSYNYYGDCWTLPKIMNATELYLHIRLVAPDDQNLSFKLMIGGFTDVDGDTYSPVSEYTALELNNSHRLIKGDNDSFTCSAGATLLIDGLNLLKALNNATDIKDDAFQLLFVWATDPNFDTTGSIQTRINGSALLGVK